MKNVKKSESEWTFEGFTTRDYGILFSEWDSDNLVWHVFQPEEINSYPEVQAAYVKWLEVELARAKRTSEQEREYQKKLKTAARSARARRSRALRAA